MIYYIAFITICYLLSEDIRHLVSKNIKDWSQKNLFWFGLWDTTVQLLLLPVHYVFLFLISDLGKKHLKKNYREFVANTRLFIGLKFFL